MSLLGRRLVGSKDVRLLLRGFGSVFSSVASCTDLLEPLGDPQRSLTSRWHCPVRCFLIQAAIQRLARFSSSRVMNSIRLLPRLAVFSEMEANHNSARTLFLETPILQGRDKLQRMSVSSTVSSDAKFDRSI